MNWPNPNLKPLEISAVDSPKTAGCHGVALSVWTCQFQRFCVLNGMKLWQNVLCGVTFLLLLVKYWRNISEPWLEVNHKTNTKEVQSAAAHITWSKSKEWFSCQIILRWWWHSHDKTVELEKRPFVRISLHCDVYGSDMVCTPGKSVKDSKMKKKGAYSYWPLLHKRWWLVDLEIAAEVTKIWYSGKSDKHKHFYKPEATPGVGTWWGQRGNVINVLHIHKAKANRREPCLLLTETQIALWEVHTEQSNACGTASASRVASSLAVHPWIHISHQIRWHHHSHADIQLSASCNLQERKKNIKKISELW